MLLPPVLGLEGWTEAGTNLGSTEYIAVSNVFPAVAYAGASEGFYYSDNEGLTWTKRRSGSFTFVLTAGESPETVITGGDICHIRISEDQGETWTEFELNFPHVLHSRSGCVNPADAEEVFIGTALGIFRLVKEDGIWQSPERIITQEWKEPIHQDLAMFPDDPDTIYSGTHPNGLMIFRRPANARNTWETVESGSLPSGFGNLNSLCLDPDTETIYIGSSTGKLFKTGRDTIAWSEVQTPPGEDDLPLRNMHVTAHYGLLAEFGSRLYQFEDGVWSSLKSPYLAGAGYSSIKVYNNNDIIIASNSGCFVYDAKLDTWQIRNRGINDLQLSCVSFHPIQAQQALMGSQGTGIFYTVDGGISWIQSNRGLGSLVVNDLARDPLNPDTVYAAGGAALSKSEDNGRTWRQIGRIGPNDDIWIPANIVKVFAVNDKTIIQAGCFFPQDDTGLLYRSEDGGETFEQSVTPFNRGAANTVFTDTSNPNRVFCGVETENNVGKLWLSDDAGITFSDVTPDTWTQSQIPKAMVRHPGDPQIMWMAVSYKGAYRSFDGGDTWEFPGPDTSPYWTSIAFDNGAPDVLCMTANESIWPYRGVYMSFDQGETWDWSGFFDTETRTMFVASDPDRHRIWVVRRDGSVWETSDQAVSWTQKGDYYISTTFNVNDLAVSPRDPDVLYMATEAHGVWKSEDAGWSWEDASTGLPSSHRHVRCIDVDTRIDAGDADRLLLGCSDFDALDHRVYESTDAAGQWVRKDTSGAFNATIVDINIVEIPATSQAVWLTTYGDGPWLSVNDGASWQQQSMNPPPPANMLTSITHTPYGDDNDEPWIFVSSHGGGGSFAWNPDDEIFHARNSGLPIDGTGNAMVDFIRADPERYGVLWAGTSEGLYTTTDFGEYWVPAFPADPVSAAGARPRTSWLAFDNGHLYYFRRDIGVFRSQDGLTPGSWTHLNNGLLSDDRENLSMLIAAGAARRRHLFAGLTNRVCLTHPLSLTMKATGTDIRLSDPLLYPGDLFDLSLTVSNCDDTSHAVELCLLMDAYGIFFWWPSWQMEYDSVPMVMEPGQVTETIFTFTWPTGAGDGCITLYSAMLDAENGSLIGDFDWLPMAWSE